MADLLSDQPLTSPSDDALDRAAFAQKFAKSILTIGTNKSFVYSIEGAWGSGKSTILEFTKHYLTHRDDLGQKIALEADPIIIDLSLWWFSGSGDLLHQFLGQISAQLRGKVSKALQKLPGLLDTLSDGLTLASAAAPVLAAAIPATKAAAAIAIRAATPPDLHALHGKLRKLLEEQSQRIVVFLDDIDRLQPNEILQVFQAVKAIAALPRLIYVLAFDRSAVAAALKRAGIENHDEYFEKIIQASWAVPLPAKLDLDSMMKDRILKPIREDAGARWQQERWTQIYWGRLDQLIGTPRQINRLTNAVRASLPPVKDEVNPVDFIAFHALKVLVPKAYGWIRDNAGWLAASDPGAVARRRNGNRPIEQTEPFLTEIREDQREAASAIVVELFPPQQSAGEREDQLAERRICHERCFPFYDRLALPPGRLERKELRRILKLESTYDLAEKLQSLAARSAPGGATELDEFLEDAVGEVRDLDASEVTRNLTAILEVADEIVAKYQPSGGERRNLTTRFTRLADYLVQKLPPEDRSATLETVSKNGKSPTLMNRCLDLWSQSTNPNLTRSIRGELPPLTEDEIGQLRKIIPAEVDPRQ